MGSYKRKDGTTIATTTIYNKALNKRGISKLIHVVPAHPAFKSPQFAMTLAALFGTELLACVAEKSGSTDDKADKT
ncbi:MAG: hypothetical protein PSV26_16850 [Polaromonas sp.]|uniref:hypothetical protein n=1 Tax=Polaromonas sp. TaxID=1869339 RepID=UPI0024885C18|nr:hypothetical protein [Polaromonas sp.]MDI1239154.1 hypothetical protein [Polaromonas sp.]